jgi:hypothetical protein
MFDENNYGSRYLLTDAPSAVNIPNWSTTASGQFWLSRERRQY